MRFALMIEPQQGLTYDENLAVAQAAEESGFETLLRSDHYTSFPGKDGLRTTDAWTTIAGITRETSRIRLGTLVSPVTFRIPGSFAKVVANVHEMGGGRVELGVGIGWNEVEHRELGLPFPDVPERFDMLEEQLTIFDGLWKQPDGWTFHGRHWQVDGSRFRPRPVRPDGRPGVHLILGGDGKRRALSLTARFADEYNLGSAFPDAWAGKQAALDEACAAVGRDPGEIVRSAMTGVLVGANEAEVRDRVREQIAMLGNDPADADRWLDERRPRWIMGTPEQAMERIAAFEAGGTQRLMLQDFIPRDLDMIRFIGREILPG
jgi:F420-dependent oxidoreductase-like protein